MILPLSIPEITAYLHHAYLIAPISNRPDFKKWFFSNYIQIISPKVITTRSHLIDFYPTEFETIPILSRISVDIASLSELDSVVPYLCEHLAAGHYARVPIDEYFMPDRWASLCRHMPHITLLFGYDNKKRVFNELRFDKKGSFGKGTVKYQELNKSFVCLTGDYENLPEYYKQIRFYVYEKKQVPFCIDSIISEIQSYFLSIPQVKKTDSGINADNYIWGMDCYDNITQHLLNCPEKKKSIDYRVFHLLWEHKKIMLGRFLYLEEHKYLKPGFSDRFKEIVQLAQVLRFFILKLNATRDSHGMDRSLKYLDSIRQKEHLFFESFFSKHPNTNKSS